MADIVGPPVSVASEKAYILLCQVMIEHLCVETEQAMTEHPHIALVRRGYEAFNKGDVDTLRQIIANDCVQHVGGDSQVSGEFKGIDAMLAYYGQLAELTGGTFRAVPELYSTDGNGHVIVVHHLTATRGDKSLDQRGALLFQIAGDKAVDLLQCDVDLEESDRFWS